MPPGISLASKYSRSASHDTPLLCKIRRPANTKVLAKHCIIRTYKSLQAHSLIWQFEWYSVQAFGTEPPVGTQTMTSHVRACTVLVKDEHSRLFVLNVVNRYAIQTWTQCPRRGLPAMKAIRLNSLSMSQSITPTVCIKEVLSVRCDMQRWIVEISRLSAQQVGM